jgi:hypothetical protein
MWASFDSFSHPDEYKENDVTSDGKWMSYGEASRRTGYTEDALRRFVREGRIRITSGWLPPPFSREKLLREDVETIRRTMSGGARDWVSD